MKLLLALTNRTKQLAIVLLLVVGLAVYLSHLATAQLVADCGNGVVTNFPTFSDGITDDAAAFRQGFEALAQCGGGTLYVPAGKFAIKSNVTTNFLHRAQKIVFRGNGSSSQLHIAVGGFQDAFVFQNVIITVENLTAVGGGIDGADTEDALNAFHVQGGHGIFQFNLFVGLGAIPRSPATRPATIRFSHGAQADVHYNNFWACRSVSAYYSGTIIAENYTGFRATRNKFLDYSPSFVNGNYYSTNPQAGYAWILLFSPYQDTEKWPMETAGVVEIAYNFMDEGAYYGVAIIPQPAFLNNVRLNHNAMNVGVGAGYFLFNIKHLTIEGGFAGLHIGGNQVDAIRLHNVHYPTINGFEVSPITNANRLTVDSGTKMLRVIDSPFASIVNNAQAWRIENGATVTTFPTVKTTIRKLL